MTSRPPQPPAEGCRGHAPPWPSAVGLGGSVIRGAAGSANGRGPGVIQPQDFSSRYRLSGTGRPAAPASAPTPRSPGVRHQKLRQDFNFHLLLVHLVPLNLSASRHNLRTPGGGVMQQSAFALADSCLFDCEVPLLGSQPSLDLSSSGELGAPAGCPPQLTQPWAWPPCRSAPIARPPAQMTCWWFRTWSARATFGAWTTCSRPRAARAPRSVASQAGAAPLRAPPPCL